MAAVAPLLHAGPLVVETPRMPFLAKLNAKLHDWTDELIEGAMESCSHSVSRRYLSYPWLHPGLVGTSRRRPSPS